MKDQDDIEKSGGAAIEKSVVWCQICIPSWQMIVVRTRKAKGVSRNVVAAISHNQYKDFFLNKKCFGSPKIGSEIKIIEQQPMNSTKLIFYALIIKYTSKTLEMMYQLMVIRVNYIKNSYLDRYLQKLSCQAIKKLLQFSV